MEQKPSIGRIVHYVGSNELDYAAIITDIKDNGSVDLLVFATDGHEMVAGAFSVEYDDSGSKGSWHWPEKV